MYSVVLMAAMTATAEAPSFGGFWAKHCFWDDCYPARYGWVACGPGYNPIYPAPYNSCHGCGGYASSCFGWNSCHGCCGGCWSCGGGGGGFGALYTSCAGHTCYGCYGGGGIPLYAGIGYAGFGGYGNFGMYNTIPYFSAPMYATPTITDRHDGRGPVLLDPRPQAPSTLPFEQLPVRPKAVEEIKPPERKLGALPTTRAEVVLKVPAGAKVFIDGNLMKSTATERVFTTPALELGESYFYTVRVVADKNGREVEDIRRVTVRAGETSQLAFDGAADRGRPDERLIVDVNPTAPQR
jgi:uncharacterized protein (TIGR03000 family)